MEEKRIEPRWSIVPCPWKDRILCHSSPFQIQPLKIFNIPNVTTLLLEEWEDDTHTPEMGTWESTGTPKTLEFDCRGQNTLRWGVLYIIEKLSKCRCRKWACMSHLDIFSTSYDKKKGRESNWQFDSRPLKVRNRPNPGAGRWSTIHRWKALDKS